MQPSPPLLRKRGFQFALPGREWRNFSSQAPLLEGWRAPAASPTRSSGTLRGDVRVGVGAFLIGDAATGHVALAEEDVEVEVGIGSGRVVMLYRGRTVSCPTVPSQIPARGFPAPGFSEEHAP